MFVCMDVIMSKGNIHAYLGVHIFLSVLSSCVFCLLWSQSGKQDFNFLVIKLKDLL